MGIDNLTCQFGVLSRPDGSVQLSEGETTVVVGVYGPVEAKIQRQMIEKASVECSFRPKAGLPGVLDRFNENLIRNISETALAAAMHKRTAILINLQELHNGGQLISCSINAVCLACLHSGIDMKFMFAAVTCFLTEEEELTLLPPISESSIRARFVFVFDSIKYKIIASHTQGSFSTEQFEQAVCLCKEESENLFKFYKKVLENR